MKEFLLEIYSEEVPARLQNDVIYGKFIDVFIACFENFGINIIKENLFFYATPLRVIFKCDLTEEFELKFEIIRGPKISAPKQAISGFLGKYNINFENLTQNGDYYEYKTNSKVIQTKDILVEIMYKCFIEWKKIWPQTMHWTSHFEWIRPIRNITCIFNSNIIDIKIADISSSNIITGHKFANPILKQDINSFTEYSTFIAGQGIVLNQYFPIIQNNRQLELEYQMKVYGTGIDLMYLNTIMTDMIKENSGLCEIPTCIIGEIDEKFLVLPLKVIEAVMIGHQKYIPLHTKDGALLRKFIIVMDKKIDTEEQRQSILNGNNKVLNARLEDALFFYNKDLKTPIQELQKRLQEITFHPKLGSIFDRIQRIKWIFNNIVQPNYKLRNPVSKTGQTSIDVDFSNAHNIIDYMKLDLCTEMVGEFSELQGYMAVAYFKKYIGDTAIPIYQYKNPSEVLIDEIHPENNDIYGSEMIFRVIIVISEWLEYSMSLLLVDEVPTSSRDPLGIRRRLKNIYPISSNIIIENLEESKLEKVLQDFACKFKLSKLNDEVWKTLKQILYNKNDN